LRPHTGPLLPPRNAQFLSWHSLTHTPHTRAGICATHISLPREDMRDEIFVREDVINYDGATLRTSLPMPFKRARCDRRFARAFWRNSEFRMDREISRSPSDTSYRDAPIEWFLNDTRETRRAFFIVSSSFYASRNISSVPPILEEKFKTCCQLRGVLLCCYSLEGDAMPPSVCSNDTFCTLCYLFSLHVLSNRNLIACLYYTW